MTFKNASIRKKLITIQIVTALVVLVLGSVVFVLNDLRVFRRSLVEALSTSALLVGGNCTSALQFMDVDTATDLLSSLREEPHVVSACIYDADGLEFASYFRDGIEPHSFPPAATNTHAYNADHLELFRSIVANQELVGTIYLRSDLQQFRDKIREFSIAVVAVLIAGMVVSLLLSLLLQRTISSPIIQLADTMKKVSDTGDYTHSVASQSDDELGVLCDGFNQMLGQIQGRDVSLREANEHLEQRVRSRTADLEEANQLLQGEIKEREQAEEGMRDAKENAEQAARQADSANRSKSVFLANMSHEIRTPMNAILGFTEVLDGQLTDPQHKNYLNSIEASGKSLLGLIDDILDLTRVEDGDLELEYRAIDVGSLISGVKQALARQVAAKGLEFRVDVAADTPPALMLDEKRLRQILVNLAGNAVKFTEEGYVGISVHTRHAEGDARQLDLIFAVEDTGIGIPEDQQERIFRPFEQREDQSINEYGGTGLGLALASRLAEIMGGQISVTSRVGKGSLFELRLEQVAIASADQLPVPDEPMDDEVLAHTPTAPKPAIEEWSPESLDDDDLKQFPAMLGTLEGTLLSTWRELHQTLMLTDIESFAEEVKQLGHEYRYPPLTKWGEKVQTQASMFQLDELPQTLEYYPQIVDQVKSLIAD